MSFHHLSREAETSCGDASWRSPRTEDDCRKSLPHRLEPLIIPGVCGKLNSYLCLFLRTKHAELSGVLARDVFVLTRHALMDGSGTLKEAHSSCQMSKKLAALAESCISDPFLSSGAARTQEQISH
jgi:hypothetical protein